MTLCPFTGSFLFFVFALKFGVVKSYATYCINEVVKLTSAYNSLVESDEYHTCYLVPFKKVSVKEL